MDSASGYIVSPLFIMYIGWLQRSLQDILSSPSMRLRRKAACEVYLTVYTCVYYGPYFTHIYISF
ncbi:hypothetical protein BDF19DRAFT_439943 [Syncephalis fuscata]|nr:hypothetical protein BDF19DRAFT_441318 [Syncephalis fuscata]KAI9595741.1 hypothetical protein BDF19DRAFT_439943 [Syncephalis fuscata]